MASSFASQQPNIAGFAEAQDRKRALLGVPVTFYWDPTFIYPNGTPSNDEGTPYDPVLSSATASAQASATVIAAPIYRLQLSPTRATDSASDALGRGAKTRIALTIDIADAPTVAGATSFELHGDRFKIHSAKKDTIAGGYVRLLVYGAALGEGT